MPQEPSTPPPSPSPANSGERRVVRTQIAWTGPLPPPDVLRVYEELVPGAAERIVSMAEKQSEHRRGIEKIVIDSGSKNSTLGATFGFIIALVALGLAGYALYKGRSLSGTAIILGTIGSLAGVFLTGKYLTAKERENRDDSREDRTR